MGEPRWDGMHWKSICTSTNKPWLSYVQQQSFATFEVVMQQQPNMFLHPSTTKSSLHVPLSSAMRSKYIIGGRCRIIKKGDHNDVDTSKIRKRGLLGFKIQDEMDSHQSK